MKVSFKSSEVTFASVNFGETFTVDGIAYIKTEPILQQEIPSFGCCLDDGSLRYFHGESHVHPITMEVIER